MVNDSWFPIDKFKLVKEKKMASKDELLKKEMCRWVDKGKPGVWTYGAGNPTWTLKQPWQLNWSLNNCNYIVDDEQAEERKRKMDEE